MSSAAASPGGLRRATVSWADRHIRLLLIAPAVLLILALTIFPLGYSLWLSFIQFDFRVPGNPFVGFRNFAATINDPIARAALWHTLLLAFSAVTVQLLIGLGLALAMARTFRGRRYLMPIFIFPLFMSPVVVGQTWRMLLDRQAGPVDWFTSAVLRRDLDIVWTNDHPWVYFSIILTDTWQWMPFMFVIILAGLVAIPEEVYEAAGLDGANARQTFFGVTLPLLVPIITLAVTFRLLDALKLFDIIFILTAGGPGTSTYTVSYYLYQKGFRTFDLGQAAAGSWLFLIMTAFIAYRLVRRLMPDKI